MDSVYALMRQTALCSPKLIFSLRISHAATAAHKSAFGAEIALRYLNWCICLTVHMKKKNAFKFFSGLERVSLSGDLPDEHLDSAQLTIISTADVLRAWNVDATSN